MKLLYQCNLEIACCPLPSDRLPNSSRHLVTTLVRYHEGESDLLLLLQSQRSTWKYAKLSVTLWHTPRIQSGNEALILENLLSKEGQFLCTY